MLDVREDQAGVFINCPFDAAYRPIFEAIVFAVSDLGFVARCALERDDGAEVRLDKINRIIEECAFGIHDLSSVALDPVTGLPRFNMPMELGLFLGCKRFGSKRHRRKACLILDADRFRYRAFLSDISGQDIHSHNNSYRNAIVNVRNWLATAAKLERIPGGNDIADRYELFRRDWPALCARFRRDPESTTYADLTEMIAIWIAGSD